jgi:GAF domain-containing protein
VATQTGVEVGLQEADAALHRLTRLVTEDTELPALFAAAAADVATTIGGDAWLVRAETGGRTAVLASHGDPAVEPTVRSPVVVDGLTWGFVCARPRGGSRVDAASLVDDVAGLVALAVARASATRSLRRLSGELAALRHVATLVAEGSSASDLFATERSSPGDLFAAVVQAIDVDAICVLRIDEDRFATVIASLDASTFAIASRWALDEAGLIASVVTAGRPVRIDDVSTLDGVTGAALRDSGIHSAVGAPIVVNGAVWGVIWAGSRRPEPLSGATEMRLRDFTELAAVGVANAESRTHLRRQADAEASLRRVAVLTAEGATLTELLDVIAAEAARILDGATVAIVQYQGRSFHVVAAHNVPILEVGSTWPMEQSSFAAAVRETGAAVRIDDVAGAEGVFAEAARAAEMASILGADRRRSNRMGHDRRWLSTPGRAASDVHGVVHEPAGLVLDVDPGDRVAARVVQRADCDRYLARTGAVGAARAREGAGGPAAGCDARRTRDRRAVGLRRCVRGGRSSARRGERRALCG